MNKRLKVALVLTGTPQKKIAETARIHPTVLSRVVHGRYRLRAEQRERLAEIIGIPPGDLFQGYEMVSGEEG